MDDLQFQKAEFSGDGPRCATCQTPIEREYFQLSGNVICPGCAEKVRQGQQRAPNAAVLRGAVFGTGMAALCWAGYATILALTGYELALVAIAVGFLVGKAVRTGSNGLGGRRVQAIAVGLTYLAITFSYIPLMLREVENWTALLIPFLAAYSLLIPFLELRESLVGGLLGVAIIGFGLLQAWRLTARDPRPLTGPFERTAEEPSSA